MRIRWSQSTNRAGQTFASVRVGKLVLEVSPSLFFGETRASFKLGGRRWSSACGSPAEAKRVLAKMARALGQ